MRDFWHFWHDNVENSNCTYLIVENIPSCFPHCGIINVSSTKLSTLLIIWNIFSTFLQLNQKIHGDFHKSFRNLPNFFREHARGARAIFHLWRRCKTVQDGARRDKTEQDRAKWGKMGQNGARRSKTGQDGTRWGQTRPDWAKWGQTLFLLPHSLLLILYVDIRG